MAYVLVVDDEPDVLRLVAMLLEKAGYNVLTAGSGIEALRVLREEGPPVIGIVDVAMPELSGLDLVRVLRGRSDTASLPIVFLSARVLPSDIAAGHALGATYVTKPFSRSGLLAAIQRELAGRAQTAAEL